MAAPAYSNIHTIGRRPNSRNACPICESRKTTKGCYWREDSLGHWVMAYCKTPSGTRATNSPVPGQYIHINKNDQNFVEEMAQLNRKIEQERAEKPLTPIQLDEIYRYFLAICPLSDNHRVYLREEGVASCGCGTLKYSRTAALAKELLKQFPKTAQPPFTIRNNWQGWPQVVDNCGGC